MKRNIFVILAVFASLAFASVSQAGGFGLGICGPFCQINRVRANALNARAIRLQAKANVLASRQQLNLQRQLAFKDAQRLAALQTLQTQQNLAAFRTFQQAQALENARALRFAITDPRDAFLIRRSFAPRVRLQIRGGCR